ncbi:MAG: hypothetical protein LKM34_06685 [Prevotella sp.]|jgi:hypothetical protein|nr:hypothetical protein [Prevotella sp.]
MKELSIKIKKDGTILFVLGIFACAILTICSCKNKTYDDKICRCFIFPTSSINNNFYIEISNNGIIKTSLGIRSKTILPVIFKDAKINPDEIQFLRKIQLQKKKKLHNTDMIKIQKSLLNLKDIECKNFFVQSWANDAWGIILLAGDKQYIFLYSEHSNDELGKIVKLLVNSSPIQIDMNK